jgi:hypothetical protein
VARLLVPSGQWVTAAIDDTLFRRPGTKVWAASWFSRRVRAGTCENGSGNNWVIAAMVVRLPTVRRLVAMLARGCAVR